MKKIISILIIIVFTSSLVGCSKSKNELNELAVVLAIGWDLTEDNKYLASVQILNSQSNSSGSMNGQNKGVQRISSDVLVYNMKGDTPHDTISKSSTKLGKNLFFSHSKYTVIGSDLAKSGLNLLVDSLLRHTDAREDNILLVTRSKASDIINTVTSEDKIPANVVQSLIKLQRNYGYVPVISRLNFANALYNKTSAPILGVINLQKDTISNIFNLSGTAVFNKDKLTGFMDMYQTRGMQWIRGEVKTGTILVCLPDNKIINFEILTAKSKIKPIIKDDALIMEVNITEEGNIREMTENLDPMKDYTVMDKLSNLQNEAIAKEAKLAVYAAQKQFKLDIFDFSGVIKRDNPDYWNKIEKNWDSIFSNIKVKINVNSIIKRPGLISKPIK